MTGGLMTKLMGGYLGRLRYPWLVALAGALLAADLLIPDFLPFLDEMLLAVVTLLLASRTKREEDKGIDAENAGGKDALPPAS